MGYSEDKKIRARQGVEGLSNSSMSDATFGKTAVAVGLNVLQNTYLDKKKELTEDYRLTTKVLNDALTALDFKNIDTVIELDGKEANYFAEQYKIATEA